MPPPLDACSEKELDYHIMGVILVSHYSLKKGIELFGYKAQKATTKELKEIHDMGTYGPQDAKKRTKQEKRDALELLLFITKKRWAYQ